MLSRSAMTLYAFMKRYKMIATLFITTIATVFIIYFVFFDHSKSDPLPANVEYKTTKSTSNTSIPTNKSDKKIVPKFLSSQDGLKIYDAAKFQQVEQTFTGILYDLSTLVKHKRKVPAIQPNRVPTDLGKLLDIKKRKELFISMMLPMALKINQDITDKRVKLLNVINFYKNTGKITPQQRSFIDDIASEFGGKKDWKLQKALDTLLVRVDTLPVSLILAQSVVESGWGTSRFAIEGNALFGQWTKGVGMVPANRAKNSKHSVKRFSSPFQSMKAYMYNINRNPAYADLRKLRMKLKADNEEVTGAKLATTLNKYSQEHEVYVNKLLSIISKNKLEQYKHQRIETSHIK